MMDQNMLDFLESRFDSGRNCQKVGLIDNKDRDRRFELSVTINYPFLGRHFTFLIIRTRRMRHAAL